MRIAVLLHDRCKPKRCSQECIKFCPRVRASDETIIMGENNKPVISEELCVGCGICAQACPCKAIQLIWIRWCVVEWCAVWFPHTCSSLLYENFNLSNPLLPVKVARMFFLALWEVGISFDCRRSAPGWHPATGSKDPTCAEPARAWMFGPSLCSARG